MLEELEYPVMQELPICVEINKFENFVQILSASVAAICEEILELERQNNN